MLEWFKMRTRNRFLICSVFFLLFSSTILADSYWDYLTKSYADTLYCRMYGDCIINNLSIIGGYFNVSVINYNVTGEITIGGNVTANYIFANGSGLTDICFSNGTNCQITTSSLWNMSEDKIYPYSWNKSVGIGRTPANEYMFDVKDQVNENTIIGLSSKGTGNTSIIFREADVVRYKLFFDAKNLLFQIYSFAMDRPLLQFDNNGDANITFNLSVADRIQTKEIKITDVLCNRTDTCKTLSDWAGSGTASTADFSGYVNTSMFDNNSVVRSFNYTWVEERANRSGYIINWNSSGFIKNQTDVYTSDEIYINKNSSNSFNLNETKLNATIDNKFDSLSFGGNCAGTPVTCDTFTTNPTCTAQEGCSWNAIICIGTPNPCVTFNNVTSCSAQAGCSWSLIYYSDEKYINKNSSNYFILNETKLNQSIDARANISGLIIDWNKSGDIKNWNSSGHIRWYGNTSAEIRTAANISGDIMNWNSSGHIRWYGNTSTEIIAAANSSGLITNQSVPYAIWLFNQSLPYEKWFYNQSAPYEKWFYNMSDGNATHQQIINSANASGYIINWNSSGDLKNWNWSGFITDWRITLASITNIMQVSSEKLLLSMNFNSETVRGVAGSEIVDDSSFYNNSGINVGASHDFNNGFNGGGAFKFDGVNDYIKLGTAPQLNIIKNMSVSMWINLNDIEDYQALLIRMNALEGGGYGYIFSTTPTDTLGYYNPNSGWITFDKAITYGSWHHIAFSYDGVNMVNYVDGSASTPQAVANPTTQPAFLEFIGGSWSTADYYPDGIIDEVRVYNRSLSADEVTALYAQKAETLTMPRFALISNIVALANASGDIRPWIGNTSPQMELAANRSGCIQDWGVRQNDLGKQLIGYWSFDHSALDYSGNYNNGTIYSVTWEETSRFGGGYIFPGDASNIWVPSLNGWFRARNGGFFISAWINTSELSRGQIAGTFYLTEDAMNINGGFGECTFTEPAGTQGIVTSNHKYINDSIWHHVLCNYNGTNLTLWVDGELENSTKLSALQDVNNDAFTIGGACSSTHAACDATWGFAGNIDEVRLYNRSLSESEIRELYYLKPHWGS